MVILSLLVMAYAQRGFMELLLLADEPSAAGMVASWYFDEWCRDSGHYTQDQVLAKVMAATHVDRAPLIVLARQAGEWVGAAELKIREMAIFPEYEYWLGGVYVVEKARGQGVASLLITEILSRARGAGIRKLYLQTENLTGGVYCRHGFKAVEHVNYKGVHVLVMVADTGIPSSPVLNSVDTWTAEQPPEPPGN
ncbi:GNAT family N-acetyltransferase [Microvirgula aerodenitrificans]|uniref:GNAT family N-acetyltransferase n=1 Tax=Microvirgula aerodenitrificans TaxID=57480 RepID=UPI000A6FDCBB|nr:GNAT family N-acetyltransferase [Microvirgula aerodenitrificans]